MSYTVGKRKKKEFKHIRAGIWHVPDKASVTRGCTWFTALISVVMWDDHFWYWRVIIIVSCQVIHMYIYYDVS